MVQTATTTCRGYLNEVNNQLCKICDSIAYFANVSESLAGRSDIVELETVSFAEIWEALPKTGLETAIVRGGLQRRM
jgi:predicted AAA+ superfamily ATPase